MSGNCFTFRIATNVFNLFTVAYCVYICNIKNIILQCILELNIVKLEFNGNRHIDPRCYVSCIIPIIYIS